MFDGKKIVTKDHFQESNKLELSLPSKRKGELLHLEIIEQDSKIDLTFRSYDNRRIMTKIEIPLQEKANLIQTRCLDTGVKNIFKVCIQREFIRKTKEISNFEYPKKYFLNYRELKPQPALNKPNTIFNAYIFNRNSRKILKRNQNQEFYIYQGSEDTHRNVKQLKRYLDFFVNYRFELNSNCMIHGLNIAKNDRLQQSKHLYDKI